MGRAVGPACGDPSLPAGRAIRTSILPRSSRWAAQRPTCQTRPLRLRRQGCGLPPNRGCCRSSGRNEIECGSRCRHRGHRSSARRQGRPALSDSSHQNERRCRCDAGKPCSCTGTPIRFTCGNYSKGAAVALPDPFHHFSPASANASLADFLGFRRAASTKGVDAHMRKTLLVGHP